MSTMRITGMASGLDTQKMVDDLMNVQRARYITPLDRSKQLNVWKRDAYQSYQKDIADFMIQTRESLGYTYLGQTGALLNRDVTTYDWAKLATTSNSSIATATATANAVDGNMTFRIDQLAKGVSKYSKEKINNTDGDVASSKDTLSKVFGDATFVDDGGDKVIKFDINGKSFRFKDTDTLESMITTINDTDDIGVKLSFVDGRFTFSTDGTGANKGFAVTNDDQKIFTGENSKTNLDLGTLKTGTTTATTMEQLLNDIGETNTDPMEITINGTTLNITKDMTVQDVIDTINGAGIADISASFTEGRLAIENTGGGLVTIAGDGGKRFMGATANAYYGQDAKGTVVGADIEITSSSNTLSFNGINIKAIATGTVSIQTEANVDGVMEKIKEFVDGYNSIVDKMNKATDEKKDRDYYPLTDDERKDLSEEQAAQWDERAKLGMLRRDSTLTTITSSMRNHLYQPVYNNKGTDGDGESKAKMSMLTDIGISTGKYTDKGKLVIDEKKLREAIEEDTEGVLSLLFKPPGSNVNKDDSTINDITDKDERDRQIDEKYAEMGVFNRILSDMTNGIKSMVDKAGAGENGDTLRDIKSNIMIDFVTKKGGPIAEIDKEIEEIVLDKYYEERRLTNYENGLWRKYASLEKTMQELNSKSQWLQAQLGSM